MDIDESATNALKLMNMQMECKELLRDIRELFRQHCFHYIIVSRRSVKQ